MISGFSVVLPTQMEDIEVTVFTIGHTGLETIRIYSYAEARKRGER